jgi:predicted MFS family arabinose efflux permease
MRRLLLALAAKVMPLDWVEPSDLAAPSMIIGGLTLAIVVAGVALGVLANGGFSWRATFLGVAAARGALAARHPRPATAPAAAAQDDLASSLDVWNTHSSPLLAR